MALTPGTRFGPYVIGDAIGSGGMGEVYRATDTALERDVAIKVLPESFASDAGRIARFEQEAKLLAALNHPNIAHIYGLERAGGATALVMELVEGPTLADRIELGPLPADEALNVAMQIADGLEAAHAQGIVHRDLKPANVKVRPDGTVKVLDFGIAKAFDPFSIASGSVSPVMTTPVTQAGIILGTAAYMSPEQARGKAVDQRTDIWAFGCVLYEMLTGQPPFGGEDVSITLARVLERDTDMASLPDSISPAARHTVELCLRKDPAKRVADIRDVKLALGGGLILDAEHAGLDSGAAAQPAQRRWLSLAATAIGALVVASVAAWVLKPESPDPVVRIVDVLPEGQGFTRTGDQVVAVSSDGSRIVYVANRQLYLRSLDTWAALPVSGTEQDPAAPFFSPDGQWIGYRAADGQMKKIALSGGAPVTIATAEEPYGRPFWGPDNMIVWAQSTGIMRVSANGGTPEPVGFEDVGTAVGGLQILPDGKSVLAYAGDDYTTGEIVVGSLESGELKTLMSGVLPTYIPTGHIVYGLDGVLFAVPFDLATLEITGGPVPLVEGVQGNPLQYAVSDSGTLVYVPGLPGSVERTLALVDRNGSVQRLNVPPKAYLSPRVSPDGQTLLVQSAESGGGVIWAYALAGDTAIQQLTFDGDNQRPAWTRDGKHITFSSDRDGTMSLYWMPADGSSAPERLTTAEEGTSHWMGSWSPDGKTLVFNVQKMLATDWDIDVLSIDDGQTRVLYDMPGTAYFGAELSRDGKWLAYGAGKSSADVDIHVEPFPPTGARRRISQTGGYWPLWSPDGHELLYRPISTTAGITLRSVDIATEPSFNFSNEQTHPVRGFNVVAYYRDYDITPDKEHLVMVFPANEGNVKNDRRQINTVLNWFNEVRERVPVP